MLLPTITNFVGIALAVATVLVVAYDHKKWTQSNLRFTVLYVPWVALSAIQCLTILSLGGGHLTNGAVWLAASLVVLAGGFIYRRVRARRTGASSPSVASPLSRLARTAHS